MKDATTLDRTDSPPTRLRVSGMDCASCAAKVENAVRRLPGIEDISVSVATETLTVRHGPATDARAIAATVRSLGYGADDTSADAVSDAERPEPVWWQSPKALLAFACAAALVLAYAVGQAAPAMERWAFLAAMAVGLVPIARRAVAAARHGTPFSIETLMSVAAIGATAIGATEEAATVVFLFLVGEVLEGVAAGRARASIRGLTGLVPDTALLEGDGSTERVPAASLRVGATVLVRPGDRVPADGTVLDGESAVDEAPVTGESVPRRKAPGDAVFAGTVNGDGALRVRVTAAARDNTIARVVRLVEDAQEAKAPTERLIDRFSRVYTPAVVAVATLVAILPPLLFGCSWNEWVYKGLAILLIGCPCALVISTPAAIAAGLSAGARRGLLIKGGAVLERLAAVTMVAFDKTGTLTEGKPVVTDVLAFGRSEREVLSLAAALEAGSSHPLAKAVLAKAAEAGAPMPPAFGSKALGGKGITGNVGGLDLFLGSPREAAARVTLEAEQEARISTLQGEGKTVAALLANGALAGLLGMRDEPRSDAKAGIDRLAAEGIGSLMLTGDNARTAQAVAGMLGIEARAGLLPEDKQRIVLELQAAGAVVAKVGDGINDAPALAAADVGIAMGGGTDVALETADAAVLHGRVADVARMVELSRRTLANIRTNIGVALGLKAVFLVTTIAGITGLWPAILADTGATVLVTANALRLLGVRLR
ncbi:cadmium-translocating P-type ATPase [Methylobacterium sp. J-043]|uniref:P-type Zn(2+) transporter n=1 Tax=Methylobacterium goesingense TaxID=243690 RepID=A0ABV2L871_9HYPH|nr:MULTISPECIES: heavy metal translocating P-type ATPase [Methylobacteriaceae]MCJ2030816.1 cadmium-translocating P-type ATPase [Methylobacterium sp. J-043]KQP04907.1 ATPase [Methylobacterium sp. Leaf99]KQT49089.1 ATPase [Methylobacterium sp. Leaf456]UYW33818.1 heavy metal translocating P-type ATPase [Methylorubrum extorquens]GJD74504.1 Zinc/cadmium/lead-transporting P-type ATPase [Methylobacterium goesingense]